MPDKVAPPNPQCLLAAIILVSYRKAADPQGKGGDSHQKITDREIMLSQDMDRVVLAQTGMCFEKQCLMRVARMGLPGFPNTSNATYHIRRHAQAKAVPPALER